MSVLAKLIGRPRLVLGALVLAQWIAVGVFVVVVRHNGWLFYQGGDQTFFYTASWVISHAHIPHASIGYGWSYLISPIAGALGPSYLAALPVLVLLQTVVLLPLAVYCVYAIARRIGGRLVGYLTAAAWVAVPFGAIPLWDHSYHVKFVEQFLPQAFGLTGLGDFPSMVCLLVAALFCFRVLDTKDPLDGVLAGVAAGFAIGIKPANALFLAGPALAFGVGRRFREGATFALALLPALVALALWKYRGLGYLPILRASGNVAAQAPTQIAAALPFPRGSHRYLHLDWSQFRENYVALRQLFWGAPVWQTLPILGFVAVARRSWPKALLLGGWLGAFVLVKGSSDVATVDSGTLLRLFMPGFPPLLILAALAPLVVLRPRSRERASESPPVGRPAVAVAVAVFAVLPLLLFAAMPPLRARSAMNYFDQNVIVPVDTAFTVDARRGSGGVIVSWRAPASRGTRVFYRVFRSRPVAPALEGPPSVRDGIRCVTRHGNGYAGTSECSLEMSELGQTRASRFVDKFPGAQPWVYRVGLAGNWRDDLSGGDVMLLSAPARLTARP